MRKSTMLFITAILCGLLMAAPLQAQPANEEDKPALDLQRTEKGKAVDTDKPALETNKGAGPKTDDSDSTSTASAPYDVQFIDTMSAHHKNGIKMSQMALKKTQNAQLKQMLNKMIQDEQAEIQKMKSLRKELSPAGPKAVNMDLPGMSDPKEDMKELKELKGTEFEPEFMDKMTKHHEGAIEMAEDADGKAEHPQIKALAKQMIEKKQKEIDQMKALKDQLGK